MKKKAGFTLSELLIVVAIVGVLVAISIPIFTQQIHKAEVATDWANVRSYYAQLQYDFMETGKVKDEYLNITGHPGLTSFNLSGQTVHLKAVICGLPLRTMQTSVVITSCTFVKNGIRRILNVN